MPTTIIELPAGVDIASCPTCGGPMSVARFARNVSLSRQATIWSRKCLDQSCDTSTYSTEGPPGSIVARPAFHLPARLPFHHVEEA